MSEASLEEQFVDLCKIVRAQHFAWRKAVRDLHPDLDAGAATAGSRA